MPDYLYDAFLAEERAYADWPFGPPGIPDLPLRAELDYLNQKSLPSDIEWIFNRLRASISGGTRERFGEVLDAIVETVAAAIDQSDSDAYAIWSKHSVWVGNIADRIDSKAQPAAMLVECINLVGQADTATEQEMCAAMGLWCWGEWLHAESSGDTERKLWAMGQIAISIAEAEFYRGWAFAEMAEKRKLSRRNRDAANKRHQARTQAKVRAKEIWLSKEWRVQVDAARAIAEACHIVPPVALRWIRAFKAGR